MKKYLKNIKEKKEKIQKYANTATGQEKKQIEAYLAQMSSGRGIAIIGALCPLLWISILSGQSAGAIAFNFCHSMIYVAIGLFMYSTAVKKGLQQIAKNKSSKRSSK